MLSCVIVVNSQINNHFVCQILYALCMYCTSACSLVSRIVLLFIKPLYCCLLFRYSRHPHIVHVEHCFHSQSRFGLIMEFIDGRNLWQIIQEEGALSRENAHKCAKAVGSALDHLHSKNIMHRDVKPDNVLVMYSLM